jgi:hypothetical protein
MIKSIETIPNDKIRKFNVVKEVMDKYVPDIDLGLNVPCKNGVRCCITGNPGSGKSNLLLNLFDKIYRGKFDNIYYFCPASSIESVFDHPFKNHDKVFNELNAGIINGIAGELETKKQAYSDYLDKMKERAGKKKKRPMKKSFLLFPSGDDSDESDEEIEPVELEYSCIIIDDMAGDLKNNKELIRALKKFLIRTRHLMCCFFITLQSYYLMEKQLRKLMNHAIMFKPTNNAEWVSFCKENLAFCESDSLKLHDYVFDQPYKHMDIDLESGEVFENFNKLDIKK